MGGSGEQLPDPACEESVSDDYQKNTVQRLKMRAAGPKMIRCLATRDGASSRLESGAPILLQAPFFPGPESAMPRAVFCLAMPWRFAAMAAWLAVAGATAAAGTIDDGCEGQSRSWQLGTLRPDAQLLVHERTTDSPHRGNQC